MDDDTRQHLKLAFVMHHVHAIVAADGEESFQEYQLLGQLFPRALLTDAGFLDDGQLTARWRDHRDASHRVLPELPRAEREEVFQLLWQACGVDEMDARELRTLSDAGVALGFTSEEVTQMIVDFELG